MAQRASSSSTPLLERGSEEHEAQPHARPGHEVQNQRQNKGDRPRRSNAEMLQQLLKKSEDLKAEKAAREAEKAAWGDASAQLQRELQTQAMRAQAQDLEHQMNVEPEDSLQGDAPPSDQPTFRAYDASFCAVQVDDGPVLGHPFPFRKGLSLRPQVRFDPGRTENFGIPSCTVSLSSIRSQITESRREARPGSVAKIKFYPGCRAAEWDMCNDGPFQIEQLEARPLQHIDLPGKAMKELRNGISKG